MRFVLAIVGALAGYLVATNLAWPILPAIPVVELVVVLAAMVGGSMLALKVRSQ